jgi:hypothetical protein
MTIPKAKRPIGIPIRRKREGCRYSVEDMLRCGSAGLVFLLSLYLHDRNSSTHRWGCLGSQIEILPFDYRVEPINQAKVLVRELSCHKGFADTPFVVDYYCIAGLEGVQMFLC